MISIPLPPILRKRSRKTVALPPRIGTRSMNKHHVIREWRQHAMKAVWANLYGFRHDAVTNNPERYRVTLVRVRTRGGDMDGDSLAETMHGIRDGVADAMWHRCTAHVGIKSFRDGCGHLHDGDREQWVYRQERGKVAGVRVEIELREGAEVKAA